MRPASGREGAKNVSTASASGLAATPAASVAARIPPSFFSMAFGLGGLAGAWRAAARAYGVSPWLADALLATAAAIFLAVLAAQVVKALVASDRLLAELADPVQGSLAALGPASLLLLAAGVAGHSASLAEVLFWIGAAAAVVLGVWTVGGWIVSPPDVAKVTPAMYLPPVAGNLLAAIAAGAIGRTDVGWVFFGAGLVFWLVLAGVLLSRHLSAGELAPALRPLLGIELAPPAVALVAYQALEGGAPDATSRGLLGYALFVALVLLRLAGRFRDVGFAPSYWAFTFPLAALATGTLRQASAAPGSVAGALALPIFVVANAVIAVIAFHTVVAATRGSLLSRE
jgi:tellurite resistance protein